MRKGKGNQRKDSIMRKGEETGRIVHPEEGGGRQQG